ncbi:MAG: hypothetical protein QM500_17045 [Methylococcales bacterium]
MNIKTHKFNMKFILNLSSGLFIFLSFSVLSATYMSYLGDESFRSATILTHDMSVKSKNLWDDITTTYATVPGITKTEPNSGNPLLNANITALDLLVYGDDIVSDKYHESFLGHDFKKLRYDLFIGKHRVYKTIDYRMYGIEYFKITSLDNGDFFTVYSNVHPEIVRHAEKIYDDGSFDIKNKSDMTGRVRYIKSNQDANRYFLMYYFKEKTSNDYNISLLEK